VNQLASFQAIAMEHRVIQSFPKGEFSGLHRSENITGPNYQAHEPIHQRCDQADLVAHARAMTVLEMNPSIILKVTLAERKELQSQLASGKQGVGGCLAIVLTQ